MKVTFDKNVYEFIIDPEKPGKIDEQQQRECYRNLHQCIVEKKITPFVSEAVFTYEALRKKERKKVLSNRNQIVIETKENHVSIGSNPNLYPRNIFDDNMLLKAIKLGFKIFPGNHFGRLINPNIKSGMTPI